ncbi:MAG: LL-diaminopimelate aminotransferase [Oscillospiraceae bacterium]|jgi:LL-diaminopimelate aminotransferase|nr:LL-diaminopimelate aminotransferase [Oscillospiraceae bacterium]
MNLNTNYKKLQDSYLFVEIAERVARYKTENPGAEVIRLGIGDVTRPLGKTVVEALKAASDEMGTAEGFRGYSPDSAGYPFLKNAIAEYYKSKLGVDLHPDTFQVNDGAKSDLGNFLDILGHSRVLVPDPVYPAYVDTNITAGNEIIYMAGNENNNFLPMPDYAIDVDVIYLCSPNNPTGAVYSREQLAEWVKYARHTSAIILFDAAYGAFIRGPELPASIFSIPGAEKCAVEFGTLSKMAGFTGTRCGWTAITEYLVRNGESIAKLWFRRQSFKFNGVAYVIQKAAEAALSPAGLADCQAAIDYYAGNAEVITNALEKAGVKYCGGANSPYVWLKCPDGLSSWDYFDYLLKEKNVVGTPGAGFGVNGEGWFRLTSFGTRENTEKAATRLAG